MSRDSLNRSLRLRRASLRPAMDSLEAKTLLTTISVFSEGFNGVPLSTSNVWSPTAPDGWDVDNSNFDDSLGVTEWRGWTFADGPWWSRVSGDQQRSQFIDSETGLSSGTLAVADPDEWDDLDSAATGNPMDSSLISPVIDVTGVDENSLVLSFDSSWRDEDTQAAEITVVYNGDTANPVQVLLWSSDPNDPNFKDDAPNERLDVPLNNPAGTTSVEVSFRIFDATNDWWWAVDDIEVNGTIGGADTLFASEDFESVVLGGNVDENGDLSTVGPAGVTVENTSTPGGNPDYAGFTFINESVYYSLDPNDVRGAFDTFGNGTIVTADPAFYAEPLGTQGFTYDAFMTIENIDVLELEEGTAQLSFGLGFVPGDEMEFAVSVSFDGGSMSPIFVLDSAVDPAQFGVVTVPMNNPLGASTASVEFAVINGGSAALVDPADKFVAIDDVQVEGETSAFTLYAEDFESIPSGEFQTPVDEPDLFGNNVYNAFAPQTAGAFWQPSTNGILDRSGIAPNPGGVSTPEFGGWTTSRVEWWASVTGDEGRSGIIGAGARGGVLFADPAGYSSDKDVTSYDMVIQTPTFNLGGDAGTLDFILGWNPGVAQVGTVSVSYDGGTTFDVLATYDSDPSSPDFLPFTPGESVSLILGNPNAVNQAIVQFSISDAEDVGDATGGWFAVDNVEVNADGSLVFQENFDDEAFGLPFGLPNPLSRPWTPTAPAGMTVDNSQMPTGGVTEWTGWTFSNRFFWSAVAQDQQRFDFSSGQNIVAVADPDEFFDADAGDGLFNSFLSTPEILLEGVNPESALLTFDSSWRAEDFQTAIITVDYFDTLGNSVVGTEVLRWESVSTSPFFKPDATDEQVVVPLNNPVGAETMVVNFAMVDGANDWWWAIDNIEIIAQGDRVTVFEEDWESVNLGLSPQEARGAASWTTDLPDGFTRDNTGNGTGGAEEWAQFNISDKLFWSTAGGQGRNAFTKGRNNVLVADGDEWDDGPNASGTLNSIVITPEIDLTGAGSNLAFQLDHSWLPFGGQEGFIDVSLDGGTTFTNLLTLNTANSGGNSVADRINESVSLPVDNTGGASSAIFNIGIRNAGNDWWWAVDNLELVDTDTEEVLFSENFDGVDALNGVVFEDPYTHYVLNPTIDPESPHPDGWTLDNSQMPSGGVLDWSGWTFSRIDYWTAASGNQGRDNFTLGSGVVMIADPDEFDDLPRDPEPFNSFITTVPIDLTGVAAGTGVVSFDSSFRPYANQTGTVDVSFDGGTTFTNLLTLDTDSIGGNSLLDRANVREELPIGNTGSDSEVLVRFGMTNAGNDWWWAVDNITVEGEIAGETEVIYEETFDTLDTRLDLPINEFNPLTFSEVWSDQAPEGWTNDPLTTPEGGVADWFGWTFADPNFWSAVAGDQNRSQFTKGQGVVAIADPDEYDDGPITISPDLYETLLTSPTINIDGIGGLVFTFDSSWRPEDSQKVSLTATYDEGLPSESSETLFTWVSRAEDATGDRVFKPDSENETLVLDIPAPEGAQTVSFDFLMFEAGNDWWWAIDNLSLAGIIQSDPVRLTEDGNLAVDGTLGDDTIVLTQDDVTGEVSVDLNGTVFGGFMVPEGGQIEIETGLGFDVVDASDIGRINLLANLGEGDDTADGGRGDDTIMAGPGDDSIRGLGGFDSLMGMAGDDTMTAANGDDFLDGGDGNDSLTGGGDSDTIFGGQGDDFVNGDQRADFIDGGLGADTLIGRGDDDTIFGGEGDDSIRGSNDNDEVDGGSGNDTIEGNNGQDTLMGRQGNDLVLGGQGTDTMMGNAGDDTLDGGRGRNEIDGGVGADLVQLNGNVGSQQQTIDLSPTNLVRHRRFAGNDVVALDILTLDMFDLILLSAMGGNDTVTIAEQVTVGGTLNGGGGVDSLELPNSIASNWTVNGFEQ